MPHMNYFRTKLDMPPKMKVMTRMQSHTVYHTTKIIVPHQAFTGRNQTAHQAINYM